jgi:hypothetical protein
VRRQRAGPKLKDPEWRLVKALIVEGATLPAFVAMGWFPELKAIIALRDPRDALIGCFFLNIMPT